MRALLACAAVACAAALAAGVDTGYACSCAPPDPRAALAQADGAFVGKLVSRREAQEGATLVFEVERAFKGSIGDTIEVRTGPNSAACGIEAPIGSRLGLVLERRGGIWEGSLCWQFAPEELLAAALPLPPPNGRGPLAVVVGAQLGATRLLALDANGRTLAYGRGEGQATLVSICPQGRRLAELAYTRAGTRLVVREARTLRRLRQQFVRLPLGGTARLACADPAGSEMVMFAIQGTPLQGEPLRSAVYRLRPTRLQMIWRGPAHDADITSRHVYLSAGQRGRTLVRLDLRTGRATVLVRLPGPTTALAASADGRAVAGVVGVRGRPTRVVRVGLAGSRVRVQTAQVAKRDSTGQVFWLPRSRLLFTCAYGCAPARVLDGSLVTRSRFRWTAGASALSGARLYGVDHTMSLFRAALPSGPQRTVRRLPGRPTVVASATS